MKTRSWWNQVTSVTAMNIRNLPARLGTSLVAVIGIGGVVAVLVALLSMGEGFRAALDMSGSDDVALVLRGGSTDELSSSFSTRGIQCHRARARQWHATPAGPIASGELYTIVDLPMRSTGTPAQRAVSWRHFTSNRSAREFLESSQGACSTRVRTR